MISALDKLEKKIEKGVRQRHLPLPIPKTKLSPNRLEQESSSPGEPLAAVKLLENQDLDYMVFMQNNHCYDAMPISAKLFVFDTRVTLDKIFYALSHSDCRTALLYDKKKVKIMAVLLVSDFVGLVVKFKSMWPDAKSFAEGYLNLVAKPISDIMVEYKDDNVYRTFDPAEASESLYEAVQKLIDSAIYRLPIINPVTGNVLFVMTHFNLLKFIYGSIQTLPTSSKLYEQPRKLNVGTFEGVNLITVTPTSDLFECIRLMFEFDISAVPVLNCDGSVKDVISRFDIASLVHLCKFDIYSISVQKALELLSENVQIARPFFTCSDKEPLWNILRIMMDNPVTHTHRVFIVDDNQVLQGIVSLSDIVKFVKIQMHIQRDHDNGKLSPAGSFKIRKKSSHSGCSLDSVPEEKHSSVIL